MSRPLPIASQRLLGSAATAPTPTVVPPSLASSLGHAGDVLRLLVRQKMPGLERFWITPQNQEVGCLRKRNCPPAAQLEPENEQSEFSRSRRHQSPCFYFPRRFTQVLPDFTGADGEMLPRRNKVHSPHQILMLNGPEGSNRVCPPIGSRSSRFQSQASYRSRQTRWT